MKLTKSKLKRLISEVMKEYPSDFDPEDAPSFFNESHGFPYPWERQKGKKFGDADEEEIREWDEFIERDMLALHATLENAKEALGTLSPEREEIFDLLVDLVDSEDDDEEEDYEESRRRAYDKEEAAARREGPSTPRTSEEISALYDDDDEDR